MGINPPLGRFSTCFTPGINPFSLDFLLVFTPGINPTTARFSTCFTPGINPLSLDFLLVFIPGINPPFSVDFLLVSIRVSTPLC